MNRLLFIITLAVGIGALYLNYQAYNYSVSLKSSAEQPEIKAPLASPLAQKSNSKISSSPSYILKSPEPTYKQNSLEARSPFALPPQDLLVEAQLKEGFIVIYGDVLVGKPEHDGTAIKPTKGVVEIQKPFIWTTPEIPYLISKEIVQLDQIKAAFEYLEKNTPLRFVPFNPNSNANDVLSFEKATEHCYSYLGRIGGIQPIRLAPGCHTQEILHELMHALGFIHEQSRNDRDLFVNIHWEDIEKDKWSQFAIVPEVLQEPLRGTLFDYQSIMLYSPSIFALSKKKPTLSSKTDEAITPVKRGLSTSDIQRIKRLYVPY